MYPTFSHCYRSPSEGHLPPTVVAPRYGDLVISHPALVALDIETTGLTAETSQVKGIGLACHDRTDVRISDDEGAILAWVEQQIRLAPPGTVLVTWNGEEFDLPFLKTRFDLNGMASTLELRSRGMTGKYGKPLYSAKWGQVTHVDIAERYRLWASTEHISWRLKPVARALLGVDPVEVDNRGEAIAVLDRKVLERYLRSDVDITLALAERALVASGVAKDQVD